MQIQGGGGVMDCSWCSAAARGSHKWGNLGQKYLLRCKNVNDWSGSCAKMLRLARAQVTLSVCHKNTGSNFYQQNGNLKQSWPLTILLYSHSID